MRHFAADGGEHDHDAPPPPLDKLLLPQMAQQHFSLRHKVGAVAHQANPFQLGIDGIAQFAGGLLRQYPYRDAF